MENGILCQFIFDSHIIQKLAKKVNRMFCEITGNTVYRSGKKRKNLCFFEKLFTKPLSKTKNRDIV
jgi:hypothetical protein